MLLWYLYCYETRAEFPTCLACSCWTIIIYYRDVSWNQAYMEKLKLKYTYIEQSNYRRHMRYVIMLYSIEFVCGTTTRTKLPKTYVMLDFIIICKWNLLEYICAKNCGAWFLNVSLLQK